MSRSQLKLMAALAALVLLVVLISGALAESSLRSRELARIERSLEERAALARELARGLPFEPDERRALDALADRIGRSAGVRVTFISSDGTVVGDSQVPLSKLPGVENHAGRPEVAAALAGGIGRGQRRSDTVGRELLYLAVPVEPDGGVVRVAVSLSEVEAAAAELRRVLLGAGALGLVAALGLSYALARYMLRPIREVRRLTSAVARGQLDYRLPLHLRDELGDIADSIQRMAEQLRERLADTSQEKERLQAVLDGMSEGVLVVDSAAQIVLANDRLRRLFGVTGVLEGRTPLEAIRNADLAEILVEAETGDGPVARPLTLAYRTLRVHAVRFPQRPAAPLGTVAVFHDVTELAQLERMRREFVANASHELRTPLSAIRGFAETLLGSPSLSEEEQRSYVEVIDRHARRLGNLVGDLLELSKIESGKTPLSLGPVDCAALVGALIDDNRARLEQRELEVSHEVKGTALAWADPQAVEQILTNLIDNAIKYTEPQGRIHVAIESDDRWVRIAVRDTGIGIPEADLGRIFERFYRVDKARSRTLGGTGLGLSIVKHLVHSLGGEISVESELGAGSSFSFTLPRGASAPA